MMTIDPDLQTAARQAKALLERGHHGQAAQLYRSLCSDPNIVEPAFESWQRGLARALARSGQQRHAAYVHLHLQEFDEALSLIGAEQWQDRARILEMSGAHMEAARLYAAGGKLVQAAIAYEKAGESTGAGERAGECSACGTRNTASLLLCLGCGGRIGIVESERARHTYAEARRCWERLRGDERLRGRPYEAALVCFNLGTCCLKIGDETGMTHLVSSQRLLEEAADAFETLGQRERAFDCHQILLELGRRSRSFENLAEGFINCIRILKEDHLKYYVLQYYEDFLREALERQEFHASATLYREAADFCLRSGLVYDRYYMKTAAETWLLAADKTLRDGGPAEMAENACLSAVECLNAIGDYPRVGQTYRQLAGLQGLAPRRRQRYGRIMQRYEGASSIGKEPAPFPEYLRQSHAYPDIWYLDLIEWEHDGDPAAIAATVVGDPRYPDVVRRRALNLVLALLDGAAESPAGLAQVAEQLGNLQIYAVLSVLEKLFDGGDARVQRGVMRAVECLFFKRSFVVLARGLRAEDDAVREAAISALGRLHFNHAFDPLMRIFREHEDLRVRRTALRSLGNIPQIQAGDFLLEVLRYEPEPLRGDAKRLLMSFQNRELYPILRQHYEMEAAPVRDDLADVLRHVGAL